MPKRVLIVSDENLAEENEVPAPLRPLLDDADDVYVVAPTLTTPLQSLTGDIDHAHDSAADRLTRLFEHMYASGLHPHGTVGDEDQLAAIGDALADFDADLIVLRLHTTHSHDANWREHRLARRVRSRFNRPTIAFFFDHEGHVVGGPRRIVPAANHSDEQDTITSFRRRARSRLPGSKAGVHWT